MSKELDYDNIDWSQHFKLDDSSPSGLVWNRTSYSFNGNKLEVYPGKLAGTLHDVKNGDNKAWAVSVKTEGKSHHYKVHRIIAVMNGLKVNGKVIDHINGVSSDNTLSNLRVTDILTNSRNCKVQYNSPYGMSGVGFQQDKAGNIYFVGRYRKDGKPVQGSFPIHRLGLMEAFKQAVIFRQQGIALINSECLGSKYTERHTTIYESISDEVVYTKSKQSYIDAVAKRGIKSNNKTGVIGISYDKLKNSYTASFTDSLKKQISKGFSIKKYGLLPSFTMACEYLLANNKLKGH